MHIQYFFLAVPAEAGFEPSNLGSSVICAMAGNTKGGSITVPLTTCLTGLD